MFAPRGWLKRPVARRIYRTIASSDLFDARWYRSTQVSGLASLMDPLWHYLDHGAAVGLDPSPGLILRTMSTRTTMFEAPDSTPSFTIWNTGEQSAAHLFDPSLVPETFFCQKPQS
jgi:hypothetical protein